MDASTDGLEAVHGNPGTTIQMNLKQTDFLRNMNDVFCLLWMPQQIDLLLHRNTVRFYVLFTMDASKDGPVAAYEHC